MRALSAAFYARPVVVVARELIGCVVEHGGAAGVIVETEAYHDSEPASHAFGGLTARTQTLFGAPGLAYVYRSYGVHALLNAVCEQEGVGAGVLIRALQPVAGIDAMFARRGLRQRAGRGAAAAAPSRASRSRAQGGRTARPEDLCSGPGKLTQALGVELGENGCSLSAGPVVIGAPRAGWRDPAIVVGKRVGITRAVDLPWRFCAAGNPNVSRPRPSVNGRSPWRSRAGAAPAAAAAG